MIIKKLFTDWKETYVSFLLILLLLELLLASFIYVSDKPFNGFVIFCLSGLFILFHVLFVVTQLENDKDKLQKKALPLTQFVEKYDLSEERALWLLKEGKINGTLSFEDVGPPEQSKETVRELIKATE